MLRTKVLVRASTCPDLSLDRWAHHTTWSAVKILRDDYEHIMVNTPIYHSSLSRKAPNGRRSDLSLDDTHSQQVKGSKTDMLVATTC